MSFPPILELFSEQEFGFFYVQDYGFIPAVVYLETVILAVLIREDILFTAAFGVRAGMILLSHILLLSGRTSLAPLWAVVDAVAHLIAFGALFRLNKYVDEKKISLLLVQGLRLGTIVLAFGLDTNELNMPILLFVCYFFEGAALLLFAKDAKKGSRYESI